MNAARVGPSVTADNIYKAIAEGSVHYFTAAEGVAGAAMIVEGGRCVVPEHHSPQTLGLITICIIVLANGFKVLGESACVSPVNFNAQMGRDYAFADARSKLWPLMGYALSERLFAYGLAGFPPADEQPADTVTA